MILKDMYIALKELFCHLYKEATVKNEQKSGFLKNTATVLIIGGLLAGSFYGYKFYIYSKESSAHKSLNECVIEFSHVKNGSGQWRDIEVAFDAGYKNNSGSKLAPFFLVFKSEALFEQGKAKEAIEALEAAVRKMSVKDDFYSVYEVKLALMKMDSKDEAVKTEGLNGLRAQASVMGNTIALYYLGLYYFDKNDIENAKKYWQQLVSIDEEARKKDDSGLVSKVTSYVSMAKEKLEQLS
jgi:Tetratricopeptide repeat.